MGLLSQILSLHGHKSVTEHIAHPCWLPPKALPLTNYRNKGAHNIGSRCLPPCALQTCHFCPEKSTFYPEKSTRCPQKSTWWPRICRKVWWQKLTTADQAAISSAPGADFSGHRIDFSGHQVDFSGHIWQVLGHKVTDLDRVAISNLFVNSENLGIMIWWKNCVNFDKI